MHIGFSKERILKKYKTTYEEEYKVDINDKVNWTESMDFDMEYSGDEITTIRKADPIDNSDTYSNIMEKIDTVFDEVTYLLDKKGAPSRIKNIYEIQNRWSETRKSIKLKDKNNKIVDLILGLGGIVENEEALLNLLKRYCIVPYLFTGFYNKNLERNEQHKIESMVYNIFPLDDIPVVYILDGEETENGDKKINFVGKESHKFDRFQFMDRIENRVTRKLDPVTRNFNMRLDGHYLFHRDNTLKEMSLEIKISITQLFYYRCKYVVTEREDNEIIPEIKESDVNDEV